MNSEKLQPDQRIGHYQILRKIGEGGMGVVYQAHDTKLGRNVAIKLLSVNRSGHTKLLGRFHQEARLASSLNHPGVAQIYEIGEFEGVPFIVMEHVEGESLRARMNHEQDTGEIVQFAIQVAEALQAAHQKGVTHRDLKPENIMIDPTGRVKILDFGLAKLMSGGENPSITTQVGTETGVVIGTINYMSPEQALGMEVDQRSDIFSLGIILYEWTARKRPFSSSNMNAVINQIIHVTPAAPKAIAPGVSEDLDHVIMKCLRKKREERYQNTADLLIDLNVIRRELSGEEVSQVLAREPEFLIPRRMARILFAAIQFLYLGMYLSALYWASSMQLGFANLFGDSIATPLTIFYAITAMFGIAVRLHLLGLVTWDHVSTGVQFRKSFFLIFALDILWAFAPFSLSLKVSALFLLACIPPLVFLPFSQRTLVRSAYDLNAPHRIKESG